MPFPDDNEDRWIRRFHPSPTGVPLVCFPHAGGSASYYFPMSRSTPPKIDVMALQYPGRQDRRHEPFVDSIFELADTLCEVLEPVLDGPFAFFGHSMGAILAFEVAQRLERSKGVSPIWFFASGRRAPSRRRSESVSLLGDAELVAELRRVGGTHQRVLEDAEFLATALPVIRNDYRAVEGYTWTPAPPLNCPATVLVGESDPQTTTDEASAWREHFTGPCDLQVFPGGHFYLEAASTRVIEIITTALRSAQTLERSTS